LSITNKFLKGEKKCVEDREKLLRKRVQQKEQQKEEVFIK